MRLSTAICTFLVAVPAVSAGDEQFRCGGSIITVESSVAELLQKCGEPAARQVSTEDVRARVARGGTEKLGTTTVEKWRYDRGSRAPMIVTIADGKIQSIESNQEP